MPQWLKVAVWVWRNKLGWWHRKRRPNERPLRLYVGMPGSGKTLLAVADAVRLMRQGVRVASNVRIVDRVSGQEAEPCGSWLDMLRLTVDSLEKGVGLVVVWDELHLACDARAFMSTPAWWLALIAQRRHYGIGFIGTTQHPDQVEKRLRTLVDFVSLVKPVRGWVQSLSALLVAGIVAGGVAGIGAFRLGEFRLALWSPWWALVPLLAGVGVSLLLLFKPLPVVGEALVDTRTLDDPATKMEAKGHVARWVPWYAYAGYSTAEIMLGDDFRAYKDEEVEAEIRALTARAIAAVAPSERVAVFAHDPDRLAFEE